jgi:hypothetical protein
VCGVWEMQADALSQRAAPEQPPLPPSPFSSPRQKSQTKPDVLSFDGDDAPVRPPLEELIAQGDEILVPTDTTLEHAIASVNALGAAPCRIAIEAGDHHCNTVLEVSARHVAIRGLQKTNPMTDVVTHATVHGIWRLMKDSGCPSFCSPPGESPDCQCTAAPAPRACSLSVSVTRAGGEFSDLRCVNRTSDQALLSVLVRSPCFVHASCKFLRARWISAQLHANSSKCSAHSEGRRGAGQRGCRHLSPDNVEEICRRQADHWLSLDSPWSRVLSNAGRKLEDKSVPSGVWVRSA